jgi:SOS-response transcriptional repressor LexA
MTTRLLLGQTLRRFRTGAGKKQHDVEEALGIDQGKLSRLENGKQTIDDETLIALASLYDVRVSEIFAAAEEETAFREPRATYVTRQAKDVTMVPLIGWVQTGIWTEAEEPIPSDQIEEWVPTRARVSPRAYALSVEGDSMINPRGSPTFPEGSRIIVEPMRPAHPGDFVIAQRDDWPKATFKKLREDSGQLYLVPLNPQYQALVVDKHVRILGVVERIAEHRIAQ